MADARPRARGCPAEPEFRISQGNDCPPLATFTEIDRLGALHDVFWSEESRGYFVFLRHDTIKEILQQPAHFSNRRPNPNVPAPEHDLIPVTMDPPEHTKWRQVLGGYFTPRRAERMADRMRSVAAELVDGFADRGSCDVVLDFATTFPAALFLELMGLPEDDLGLFLAWTRKSVPGPNPDDPTGLAQADAQREVMAYIGALIEQRRSRPDPTRDDLISHAIGWRIDGRAPTDEELLLCCLTIFEAGLDTVNAQLSYIFHHLATHPQDRARLVREPELIPNAVEEFLRAFPIVKVGREVTVDREIGGCRVRAGDRLLAPLMAAGRDPGTYPDADVVRLDRQGIRHMSFGVGPHRCLGSHLARLELAVALEEWHRRIPDYELSDPEAVTERTGVVCGLNRLPVRWSTDAPHRDTSARPETKAS